MNNAQAQQAQQPYITIEEGERYHDARAVMFTIYNHGEAVGSYTACIGADGRCAYHCHLIGEHGDSEAFCEVGSYEELMARLIEHFTPSPQEPEAEAHEGYPAFATSPAFLGEMRRGMAGHANRSAAEREAYRGAFVERCCARHGVAEADVMKAAAFADGYMQGLDSDPLAIWVDSSCRDSFAGYHAGRRAAARARA